MALSISLIASSLLSGAHVTNFRFRTDLANEDCRPLSETVEWDGGVETAGDSRFCTFMDLSASSNGLKLLGCETLLELLELDSSLRRRGGTAAFLKEGSLALGLGAEKKDESALASFTAGATAALASFLTTTGLVEEEVPTAAFLTGAAALLAVLNSFALRFFESSSKILISLECHNEVT